jgi:SMC interacting uncharacterized protein involved in chromosome segregation
MGREPTQNVTLRLPRKTLKELKHYATSEDKSLSAYVAELHERYLRDEKNLTPEERRVVAKMEREVDAIVLDMSRRIDRLNRRIAKSLAFSDKCLAILRERERLRQRARGL